MRISVLRVSALATLWFHTWTTEAAYSQLYKEFDMENFFDEFEFFTGDDPTKGTVNYVDEATAWIDGLIARDECRKSAYIGVDHANKAMSGRGRNSVRIESKATFTRGLFLLEIDHMPHGCGTWPAFWTLGKGQWPNNGEIDIIEGVHNQQQNLMALHTSPGCRVSEQANPKEFVKSLDCDTAAINQPSNQGCSLKDRNPRSWGKALNEWGGGTIAMEWNSDFIKVWSFPKGEEPPDLKTNAPEPLNWGTPAGVFAGDCDIDKYFKQHRIIFNVTFCGDWAGSTWKESGCAAATKEESCEAYVRNNPNAFKDAYWDITSLKVWKS